MANKIISKKTQVTSLSPNQRIELFSIAKLNSLVDKLSDFQDHINQEKVIYLLLSEDKQIVGYALQKLKEYRMHGKSVIVASKGKAILKNNLVHYNFVYEMFRKIISKSTVSIPTA